MKKKEEIRRKRGRRKNEMKRRRIEKRIERKICKKEKQGGEAFAS